MILYDEPDLSSIKDKASKMAVNFITKCLEKDPLMRPTAEELLSGPWF